MCTDIRFSHFFVDDVFDTLHRQCQRAILFLEHFDCIILSVKWFTKIDFIDNVRNKCVTNSLNMKQGCLTSSD